MVFLEVHILVQTIVPAIKTICYKLNRPRNTRASLRFHTKLDKEEGQRKQRPGLSIFEIPWVLCTQHHTLKCLNFFFSFLGFSQYVLRNNKLFTNSTRDGDCFIWGVQQNLQHHSTCLRQDLVLLKTFALRRGSSRAQERQKGTLDFTDPRLWHPCNSRHPAGYGSAAFLSTHEE